MKSLAQKNIVLTGGASGIGRKIAKLAARENANLAIIDINEKALEDTRNELSKYNSKILTYSCDLSKKEDIEAAGEKIKRDFNQIDILINNAGIVHGKPIDELSYDEITFTLNVNLIAGIYMTKQFMREMMDRNSGHIVNIASVAGFIASPKMADYSASKFGVVGFSEALRLEMKKYGAPDVKVTVVCPSFTDTGLFKGFKLPFSPPMKPEYVAEKTINAIKKNKHYLIIPPGTEGLIKFAKLFPVSVQDKLWGLLGVTKAMDNFVGRR